MLLFGLKKQQHMVLNASLEDYPLIAELHGRSFARGWTVREIEDLSMQKSVITLIARPVGKPKAGISGFNMVRFAADEGEILSVAVAPHMRRRGLGELLMREAIRRLQGERAQSLFLEVDHENKAAVSLYKRLGFEIIGSRPGYYRHNGKEKHLQAMALVMRLNLG